MARFSLTDELETTYLLFVFETISSALAHYYSKVSNVYPTRPLVFFFSVIPIWQEPVQGWTDNINGPVGLLIGKLFWCFIRILMEFKSIYGDDVYRILYSLKNVKTPQRTCRLLGESPKNILYTNELIHRHNRDSILILLLIFSKFR